ncbi:MAG: DUF362 domain-containing protein [Candidatus Pacearchaeota archaeon]
MGLEKVSFVQEKNVSYPPVSDCNPPEFFPELKKTWKKIELNENNKVYSMVRESFKLLGLDSKNYGKENWNPLKELIKPDDKVVIKPNAVLDVNKRKGEDIFASITHPSIIRPVVDYVYLALGGKGKITIADAPLMHCNFSRWKEITKIDNIKNIYKEKFNFDIEVFDLRETYVPYSKLGYSPSSLRRVKKRDPKGYFEVKIGNLSKFSELNEEEIKKFYASDYNREPVINNHLRGRHKYKVSGTILDADVIISIPKMKTHQKVGTTLNMKNMVGTQGDKNYIPHYRIGGILEGGDEYPNQGILQNSLNKYRRFLILKLLVRKTRISEGLFVFGNGLRYFSQKILDFFGRKISKENYVGAITGGSWYGNDTAWRMTIDLTKIILYSNKKGIIQKTPQRKFISLVDGIVSGEEEGPLAPIAKKTGCVILGLNPVSTDLFTTTLMGFDIQKIKLYNEVIKDPILGRNDMLESIILKSNVSIPREYFSSPFHFGFKPPKGWKGFIELK